MDFFEHQEVARKKSHVLIFYFVLAVVGIIAAVYGLVVLIITLGGEKIGDTPGLPFWDPSILLFTAVGTASVVFLASSFKTLQLSGGGSVVARELGGRELDVNATDYHERRLLNLVEEMAIASGVPVPSVYVMDAEDSINAFAAGRSPSDAVIGVTRGCMTLLTRDELQGVIAHEFSHILNGDMRLNIRLMGLIFGILFLSLIGNFILRNAFRGGSSSSKKEGVGLALIMLVGGLGLLLIGYIGAFFANLIKASVSRQRGIPRRCLGRAVHPQSRRHRRCPQKNRRSLLGVEGRPPHGAGCEPPLLRQRPRFDVRDPPASPRPDPPAPPALGRQLWRSQPAAHHR
jgi:Zn-dependent protease with chaperone function